MKIPSRCKACGGHQVHTETGTDIVRRFSHGVFVEETRRPLPRRIFCDGCGEEL